MKFVVFLMFFCTLQTFASEILSQGAGLDVTYKEMPMQQVLDDIENQTGVRFLYNLETIEDKTITLQAKNKSWHEVLEQIKETSEVNYRILEDNLIVLTPIRKAQPGEVTGTVTGEDGVPLIGLTIVIKGTTTGAITDGSGNYTIPVPDENAILVFSYIGMLTQEVTVGAQRTINIVMVEDRLALDEVIVIGYGTRVKGELTGAVSTVTTDDISMETSNQVSRALQGKVSGVSIIQDSRPGYDAEIRIRGLGTINNNNPLWVVDGIPQGKAPPASQVKSVSVLKDAASTAIYGARGANGVILVTTKAGRKGAAPSVDFSVRMGQSYPTGKLDRLETYQEYGELIWLQQTNSGIVNPTDPHFGSGATPVVADYLMPAGGMEGDAGVNPALYDIQFPHQDGDGIYQIIKTPEDGRTTDWYDAIYQNALLQDYNLSITGGTQAVAYAVGLNYQTEEGIVKYSGYDRYNARTNVTMDVTDWLTIGNLNSITYEEFMGNTAGSGQWGNAIGLATTADELIPIYDIMGNWAGDGIQGMAGSIGNPLSRTYRAKDNVRRRPSFLGNLFAEIEPVAGLKIRSMLGYNILNYRNNSIGHATYEDDKPNPYNSLSISTGSTHQWNWTNTATYNRSFGNHSIEVMAGTEAVNVKGFSQSGARDNFFSTDLDFMILNAGTLAQTNSGDQYEWALFSYFGRLHYELAGRYLLDATIRRDGSSRFGSESRWGNFPAVAAGWILSNESFMSATSSWLNNLKLRASWGQSGNDQIGNYNGFTTFGSDFNNSYYAIEGSDNVSQAGYQSVSFGNPEAKWETTTSSNIAIDATFIGLIGLSVDFWQKDTKDMLFQKAIPTVQGYASTPSVNVGDMENKGIDVELNFNGTAMNGDFRYNISTVFSRYKNKIVNLSGVEDEFLGGRTGWAVIGRAMDGTAFPEFYGYTVDGIFQTQAEADAWPEAFGPGGTYNAPGRWKFVDKNGDGMVDDDDRDFIGNPHPEFMAGLNLNFNYKAFDLGMNFYGVVGNDIFWSRVSRNDLLYKSWGSPYLANNADAKYAMHEMSSGAQMPMSEYLYDGSFLRLRQLQLGYTVPASIASRAKMKNLRITLTGANLFTITKYPGLDPEVVTTNDPNEPNQGLLKGVDSGGWPLVKQFLVGLNIGF